MSPSSFFISTYYPFILYYFSLFTIHLFLASYAFLLKSMPNKNFLGLKKGGGVRQTLWSEYQLRKKKKLSGSLRQLKGCHNSQKKLSLRVYLTQSQAQGAVCVNTWSALYLKVVNKVVNKLSSIVADVPKWFKRFQKE